MPLNLSFTHLAVIGIVALVVLGPDRLPGVARTAGNLWREWKRVRGDLEGEVREVMAEFTEPFREHFSDINGTVRGVVDDIRHGPQPEPAPSPPDGVITVPPLAAALPALAPSTGLVSPGPEMRPELPSLGPAPQPGTFVPYELPTVVVAGPPALSEEPPASGTFSPGPPAA
ncbi:MAG TPA: twin-arginine translocase TatA/TatE family subunit [Acidimicrobiales bacterium]|nr:twin-arginine translocase TatA/TatE family subunit [Acidimicrobiales bacterium]